MGIRLSLKFIRGWPRIRIYREPSLKRRSLSLLVSLYRAKLRREKQDPRIGAGPRQLIDDRQEHIDWLLKQGYVIEETPGGRVALTDAGKTAAKAISDD